MRVAKPCDYHEYVSGSHTSDSTIAIPIEVSSFITALHQVPSFLANLHEVPIFTGIYCSYFHGDRSRLPFKSITYGCTLSHVSLGMTIPSETRDVSRMKVGTRVLKRKSSAINRIYGCCRDVHRARSFIRERSQCPFHEPVPRHAPFGNTRLMSGTIPV